MSLLLALDKLSEDCGFRDVLTPKVKVWRFILPGFSQRLIFQLAFLLSLAARSLACMARLHTALVTGHDKLKMQGTGSDCHEWVAKLNNLRAEC